MFYFNQYTYIVQSIHIRRAITILFIVRNLENARCPRIPNPSLLGCFACLPRSVRARRVSRAAGSAWPHALYLCVSCKWPRVVQEVRFKVHDPKAHSKGGTLENTINGRADEEAPPPPQHLIHPGKDISKLYGELSIRFAFCYLWVRRRQKKKRTNSLYWNWAW